MLLIISGCASTGPAPVEDWNGSGPVPPGYYLVREGDSLGTIARKRRISVAKLIQWNGLKPPYTIYAGKPLRVAPSAPRSQTARTAKAKSAAKPRTVAAVGKRSSRVPTGPSKAEHAEPAPENPGSRGSGSGLAWAWPLPGTLVQGFRAADPARQGLRLACRPGEAVRAAGAGQVVYSGSGLKGYGNLIIVKHNNSYLSAYGFNRRLLVAEGESVKRGQVVAECGEGPDGANLLHFEVRRDGAAVNPLLYLPPRA